MAIPPSTPAPTDADPAHVEWSTPEPGASPRPGHKEEGRTICLHSLAVLPSFQGQGLGGSILRAYVDRMEAAGAGDRIALLCLEHLVPFYERCGFTKLGASQATFGGVPWYDMVRELKSQERQIEDLREAHSRRVDLRRGLSKADEEVFMVDAHGVQGEESGVSQR